MTRIMGLIVVFVGLASIELALVASLPYPFSAVPVVITTSILILQARTFPLAAVWIACYGVLLDVMLLHTLPIATLGYGLAAVGAYIVSRSLFSNRSFYGVLGATISALIILSVTEMLVLFMVQLMDATSMTTRAYLGYAGWRMVGATILLLVLFPFGRRLNKQLA